MSVEVFVFGSNLAGVHGAGAALEAVRYHGAIPGRGQGYHGNSYAIPTKDQRINSLSLDEIKKNVDMFLLYAFRHRDLKFKVTAIGCGLAGFKHEEIAPLFKQAPKNCFFDEVWKPCLGESKNYWGTF